MNGANPTFPLAFLATLYPTVLYSTVHTCILRAGSLSCQTFLQAMLSGFGHPLVLSDLLLPLCLMPTVQAYSCDPQRMKFAFHVLACFLRLLSACAACIPLSVPDRQKVISPEPIRAPLSPVSTTLMACSQSQQSHPIAISLAIHFTSPPQGCTDSAWRRTSCFPRLWTTRGHLISRLPLEHDPLSTFPS